MDGADYEVQSRKALTTSILSMPLQPFSFVRQYTFYLGSYSTSNYCQTRRLIFNKTAVESADLAYFAVSGWDQCWFFVFLLILKCGVGLGVVRTLTEGWPALPALCQRSTSVLCFSAVSMAVEGWEVILG